MLTHCSTQTRRSRWSAALTCAYLVLFVAQTSALRAQPSPAADPRRERRWSVDVAVGGSPLSSALFKSEVTEYGRRTQTASIAARWNPYRSIGASVGLTWTDVKSFEYWGFVSLTGHYEQRTHTQSLAVSATTDYEFRLNKQWTLSPSVGAGFVPWTNHASAATLETDEGISATAAESHLRNRWLSSASLTLRYKRFAIGWQLLSIKGGFGSAYMVQHLHPVTVGFRL